MTGSPLNVFCFFRLSSSRVTPLVCSLRCGERSASVKKATSTHCLPLVFPTWNSSATPKVVVISSSRKKYIYLLFCHPQHPLRKTTGICTQMPVVFLWILCTIHNFCRHRETTENCGWFICFPHIYIECRKFISNHVYPSHAIISLSIWLGRYC